jgi:hypothetical protein
MEDHRTVTLQVSEEELRLIEAGLDLLLLTEDDAEAITQLKVLLERLTGREHVIAR